MDSVTICTDQIRKCKIRWKARRGLLENDLIITRYLDAYWNELTNVDIYSLDQLLSIEDNDLLDLFLGRKELEGSLDTPNVQDILEKIRSIKII